MKKKTETNEKKTGINAKKWKTDKLRKQKLQLCVNFINKHKLL